MTAELATHGWWIFGLALLGLEVFAPGASLLFFGIAALVIAANGVLGPDLGFAGEVVGFLAVSGAAVLVGHRWYRARTGPEAGGLNRRTERLVGRSATVIEPIGPRGGRVQVEDGGWQAEGPDAPAGATVRIISARGSVLIVEPADRGPSPPAP